ncbi:MAG TPA: phytanoyl-CoA dioxygenase family protein [Solirubrobacterales bacterium]
MATTLTAEQQERYERDGYLSPLDVLGAAEVARFRGEFERLEPRLGPATTPRHAQTHLHFRWAYELATHPALLDAVEGVIGPDILVHTTSLFCKQPRDPAFVSWHQDAHNWRLDEPRLLTAWIALTVSDEENGCLRVVPGSHLTRLDHEARPHKDNMLATGLTVSAQVDEDDVVGFVLAPGQASFHHADLVHGSNGNRSDGKRIGFAVRFVSPSVTQERPHHAVVLARGEDAYGNYELLTEPPSDDLERSLAAHDAFWRRIGERGDRPELALAPESS